MANLFPITDEQAEEVASVSEKVIFGRSWRFDYSRGEFVMTPSGKVAGSKDAEAWLEWCKKALQTERYRHLVYSRSYGQEYNELIGQPLSRPAVESEIQRMTEETLMVDSRTAGVSGFAFRWEGENCEFSCVVRNVLEEIGTIEGSVVNS